MAEAHHIYSAFQAKASFTSRDEWDYVKIQMYVYRADIYINIIYHMIICNVHTFVCRQDTPQHLTKLPSQQYFMV